MGVDCNAVGYKNPNKKVPVVVTCDQGCVIIDITPTLDKTGNVIKGIGNGGAGERGVGGVALTTARLASTTAELAAQLLAVQLLLASQIWQEIQKMRANQMEDRVATHKSFIMVNANIRRIALQPGMRGPVGTLRQQGNDDTRTD